MQLSPEKNTPLASARMSLTYKILAANKIGTQSISMGKVGAKDVKRLALIISGTKSNLLLRTKTSIAVSKIYAIDK